LDQLAEVLAPFTAGVAEIGSSSVRGLLAKPIGKAEVIGKLLDPTE